MKFKGQIRNGVVVLDEPTALPDGTVVEVAVLPEPAANQPAQIPTLYDRLAKFVGKAESLPPDLARNHDHYLHGLPKKQSA